MLQKMACSEVVPSRKWEIKSINLLNALAIDNSCSIAAISKLEVLDSTYQKIMPTQD